MRMTYQIKRYDLRHVLAIPTFVFPTLPVKSHHGPLTCNIIVGCPSDAWLKLVSARMCQCTSREHSAVLAITCIRVFEEKSCEIVKNNVEFKRPPFFIDRFPLHIKHRTPHVNVVMMTSWNGDIFRVSGPLWGESIGHRWIPLTKASDSELWCFLWSAPGQTVQQTTETPVIWYAIALTVIVMLLNQYYFQLLVKIKGIFVQQRRLDQ